MTVWSCTTSAVAITKATPVRWRSMATIKMARKDCPSLSTDLKLAARHLSDDCLVLYDVSSSYYEGHTCPLAQYGHDKDGKKGLPIIVYRSETRRPSPER